MKEELMYASREGLRVNESVSISKRNPRSVINWETGVPTKDGKYLATLDDDSIVCVDFNLDCDGDEEFFKICVLAWCKMDEIKPYKKSNPS